SVAYDVAAYRPQRPERFGEPTALAALLWKRVPWLDDPLPEVFVERLTGYDLTEVPLVPAATADCSKALLIGGRWPPPRPRHAPPGALPAVCAVPGPFCSPNRGPAGSPPSGGGGKCRCAARLPPPRPPPCGRAPTPSSPRAAFASPRSSARSGSTKRRPPP